MNKDALITEMDRFINEFTLMKEMISSGDRSGLMAKMKTSTAKRTLFDKPSEKR